MRDPDVKKQMLETSHIIIVYLALITTKCFVMLKSEANTVRIKLFCLNLIVFYFSIRDGKDQVR